MFPSAHVYALSFLLLCLLCPACGKAPARPAPVAESKPAAAKVSEAEVLARVDGAPITRWDVKVLMRKGGHGSAGKNNEKRILENIIQHEVARQRAVKLGLHKEKHIRDTLQTIRAKAESQQRRVLYKALLQREAKGKAGVTEADARAYWAKHGAEIRTSLHVLQIRRRSMPAIIAAQASLKAGKSFDEVASDVAGKGPGHGNAHKFWDLGLLRWVQIPETWRAPLRSLKDGEVSGVVKGPGSRFWLLKVKTRQEDTAGTFETYRQQITSTLKRDRLESNHDDLLNGLRAKARIEYSMKKAPAGT